MKREQVWKNTLTAVFTVICIVYMMPIVVVLFNSFKENGAINTDTFALPNAETFVGLANYATGIYVGEYPFFLSAGYSFLITILSVALILLCTSMAAWYISRVDDVFPGSCIICACFPWSCRSRWSCLRWPRPPIP